MRLTKKVLNCHLDKGQRPHGKIPFSPPTGGDFSSLIIHPQNQSFPGQILCFPHFIRKTSLPPDKLQFSHFGPQSKLQRQIAEGGIGSRKGKGPTKWEGPPAATAATTLISATPVISVKPIIPRTNRLFPPLCPQNQPFPGQIFSLLPSECKASCSGR